MRCWILLLLNNDRIWSLSVRGCWQTHLASGIAVKAIDAGYKVLFVTALELIEILELAEIAGELKKKINLLAKHDILVIDELGYLPMSKQGMYNLFQLINAMYEHRSLIITTNKGLHELA